MMMFLTATDVTLRYLFRQPIASAFELTGLMLAIVVVFGLAYAGTSSLKSGPITGDWSAAKRQLETGRKINMIAEIDETKCTGCGVCVDRCPMDVIRIGAKSDKAVIKYSEDCTGCFECELTCPYDAIYVHPVKEAFTSTMEYPMRGVKHG